jgi:prephenate dehydratase
MLVYHADWSANKAKRWAAAATKARGRWRARAPERVGDATTLLQRVREDSDPGSVVAGFDFPIGVPRAWAERAGVGSFRDLPPLLGHGRWSDFFRPAEQPHEIRLERPFYPRRGGGTSQRHLVEGLGVPSMDALLRRVDRRTERRRAACAVFWTLGPNQVGRAAIAGWRDLLGPALLDGDDLALWPFDGELDELVADRPTVVAETYPAAFYRPLGVGGAKTSAEDRRRSATALRAYADGLDIELEPRLEAELATGFADDDRFDAFVGLLGMLAVLEGRLPSGEPRDDPAVLSVEGWMLGEPGSPAPTPAPPPGARARSRTIVAYQGEPGAYGEEGARSLFPDGEHLALPSLRKVFEAVEVGRARFGLVPLDNSQAGSINETYDLILKHGLHLVGETIVRVDHCLLALPGTQLEDVRTVVSHPQAVAQSEEFLSALEVEVRAEYNTAGAAKRIAERRLEATAAIASRRAAELYGLEILAERIQTYPDNHTRFGALSRSPEPLAEPDTCSLVFGVGHVAGSLYRSLGAFAERHISLKKLESRPRAGRPWEYVFYADVEAAASDPSMVEALGDLSEHATFTRLLGTYAAAPRR